jgi:hypothetical protein
MVCGRGAIFISKSSTLYLFKLSTIAGLVVFVFWMVAKVEVKLVLGPTKVG